MAVLVQLMIIVLVIMIDQIPMIWNWSLGILFVFFFPGHVILSTVSIQNRVEGSITTLRKVGLSIFVSIVTTFCLGLWNAIRLSNIILVITSLTLAGCLIFLWKNRCDTQTIIRSIRKQKKSSILT